MFSLETPVLRPAQMIKSSFKYNALVFTAVFFVIIYPATAAAKKHTSLENRLVDIPPGITTATLIKNDSNLPDVIVKAWRENMNRHSFYIIMFLTGDGHFTPHRLNGKEKLGRDDAIHWASDASPVNVIGVEDEQGKVSEEVFADSDEEGSCITQDYRLIFKNRQAFLIRGIKKWTKSLCDENKVEFTIYKIFTNLENTYEFAPKYNFKPVTTFSAKKTYDDIDNAFAAESGRIISSAK